MEREVSTTIQIAVAMIMISALLGIVTFTVQIGNAVKGSAIEEAQNIGEIVKVQDIDALVGQDTVLPAAAAYGLIEKNFNIIISSECKICHRVDGVGKAGSCLMNHLTGKVSLQVIKAGDDQYKVIIHSTNCKWYTSGCTE